MSKSKKNTKSSSSEKENFLTKFSLDDYIPHKYQIPALIAIIVILFLIFLSPLYFGNKTFQSGDIIATKSLRPYVYEDREGFSLWFPYIFCGMPAYAVSVEQTWFNFIYMAFTSVRNFFASFFSNSYTMWSFYLIILAVTTFFFMKYITKNNLVSFFTAVATSFSTGLIVFLFIGHVTKLTSLSMYPLLFLMLLRMQEKIKLIYFFILIITLQLFIQGFHVQIIFYTLFSVVIYYIYYILRGFSRKEITPKEIAFIIIPLIFAAIVYFTHLYSNLTLIVICSVLTIAYLFFIYIKLKSNLLRSIIVFVFSLVIAILISSDHFTQIYEYTPYSTRGAESITDKTTPKTEKDESEYYAYHTMWSFSPGEVLTFIVPSLYGFGNSTYQGPLTNNRPVDVNTYFGQMYFVDVAMYMGVLVFFLALFGIFTRWKEPLVRFLTILAGVSLLISFGKTFPVLFDLLFYYLPSFNKFRVPSMILVLVQMSTPVLAGLGLMRIILLRNEKNVKLTNVLKNLAYIFTGIFILSLLLHGSINDWFISRVNEHAASIQASKPQLARQFNALSKYIAAMFSGDLLIAFGFSAAVSWLSFSYVNRKLSADFLVFTVIVFTLIDLWRIDARGAKYIDNPDINNIFKKPDYISAIEKQNDKGPFRVLNLKQDGSVGSYGNDANFDAYFFIEDFYGYSGIKPRAFQDMMDIVGPANTSMWRMLNVKYIVTNNLVRTSYLTLIDSTSNTKTYTFNNFLPRVYFVNQVEKKTGMEFLQLLKSNLFDPKEKAYLENVDLKVDPVDSTVYSKITEYKEAYLKAEVNASGNNFLFFGTTYLPGWKALIDGNETKTYLTNHGYIGIIVPKGKHIVEFKFAPESFYISRNISLVLSSIVILGLLFSIFVDVRKKKSI